MTLAHILLAITVMAIWGLAFVVIKIGLDNFPPYLLSALRFGLTAIPLIFFLGPREVPWRNIIIIGCVMGVVQFSLLFIGMDIGVAPGIASLVLQCQVFFTIIFAAIVLSEQPALKEWIGVGLAFFGIFMIALTFEENAAFLGLMLVILAGATWGVYNILMKRLGQVNMLRFIIYMSLVPPIPLLILSYQFEGPDVILHSLQNLSVNGIGSVLYLALAATAFGFGAWGFLLRTYPASKVAPFSLLVPIFGMFFSAFILGETFGLMRMIGSSLVLLGLVIIFLPASLQSKFQKS